MIRLTRAEQQARTRASVLDAARTEFATHGYADAKIDRIADRAELTRGAVYSNFPSKRALYLAVLVESVEASDAVEAPPADLAQTLAAFARVWLERLPLMSDTSAGGRLQLRSLSGVFDDEAGRNALAQVSKLEALLLGLALESRVPVHLRLVRLAEVALTLLNGAANLADTAPGFGDPFDVVRACRHLAGLDLSDTFDPPYLPYIPAARVVRDAWEPPSDLRDEITGRQLGLDADGVIVVLGAGRLEAVEEAVRAVRLGDQLTVAVVTNDPAEIGRLVRLRITDLLNGLRRVVGPNAWPGLHLILDDGFAVASALDVTGLDDTTEAAVRLRAGKIIARADGRGAAHAAATAGASN